MVTYKIPKKEYNVAAVNNDITVSDVQLVGDQFSFLDGDGNVAITFKKSDLLKSTKTAYSAGVLSSKRIDLSAVSIINNKTYSLSIELPFRQDFYGGGSETNAIQKIRTYNVSVDGSATVTELRDAFITTIQNDLYAEVTVAANSTDKLDIIMANVNSGDTIITPPSGAVETVNTAYVEPSGTTTELAQYVSDSLITVGGQYTRYVFKYRKDIPLQQLSGQKAIKHELVVVFIEQNADGYASAIALLDSMVNQAALGTAGTGVAITEFGDGRDITTILTLKDVNLGALTASVNKAHGALIYTFPAGAHVHSTTYMSVGLTAGSVTTDTPDVGVGSVIASGAVAVLGGTATFEDYITGQTAADAAGTATVKTSVATAGALTGISINEAASAKTVHLNAADGWAAGVTGNLVANGTVTLKWTKMA